MLLYCYISHFTYISHLRSSASMFTGIMYYSWYKLHCFSIRALVPGQIICLSVFSHHCAGNRNVLILRHTLQKRCQLIVSLLIISNVSIETVRCSVFIRAIIRNAFSIACHVPYLHLTCYFTPRQLLPCKWRKIRLVFLVFHKSTPYSLMHARASLLFG